MILLAHDHDCEVNWITVRSVHRLFRVSPIIFLHYGSECSYCLLSFQRHRLQGDLSCVHRSWIWLFFQAPPALLLETWANQLTPLYQDSSQITEQSATLSQRVVLICEMAQWASVFASNLTAWGQSLGPSWRKERNRPHKLSSVLHTGAVVHVHAHTNVFRKNGGVWRNSPLVHKGPWRWVTCRPHRKGQWVTQSSDERPSVKCARVWGDSIQPLVKHRWSGTHAQVSIQTTELRKWFRG